MSDHQVIAPDLLSAALDYASKGLPVIPCNEHKRPRTEHGLLDATTDEAQIRDWWTRWPDAMIGMPTGPRSGVWVLDIDDPQAFEANCPITIPETRRCDTGKGYHLYFRFDPSNPIRNTQRTAKQKAAGSWPIPSLPGAETRGDGGYVIVPPSVHPTGRLYRWASSGASAQAPTDLYNILVERAQREPHTTVAPAPSGVDTPYGLKALDDECAAVRGAGNGEQEGSLNEAALKIGALVAGGELSMATAKGRLLSAGLAMPSYNSRDQWTADAVVAKVERGMSDGAAHPRSAPKRDHLHRPTQRVLDASAPEEYGFVDEDGVWTAYGPDWQEPVANVEAPTEIHQILDLATLAEIKPSPKMFAIERLAPLGEVTLFTGPGSAGKSLLGQQLATCAAAGLPCLRLSVQHGPAIYLTCEDDEEQLHWRQAHICQALEVSMAELAGKLHLISLRGALDNDLGTFSADGRMIVAPAYKRLVATINKTGSKLVFLDNVAHLFTGNENDRGDVTRFVNLLNRLAGETGAAIVLIGHPPKPSAPNAASHDYSGSTAWLNAVRSQFKIDHERIEGSIVDRDARIISVGKANYAAKGDALRLRWQDWAFVHEDDLPRSTLASLDDIKRATADQELFKVCLAERTRQRRAVSEKRSATFAPIVFATMPESKKIGAKRLETAMDQLFRIGEIERAPLWRGPDRKWVVGLRLTAGDGAGDTMQETQETVE